MVLDVNTNGSDKSTLFEEFRDYARRVGQAFVSTHSPDFLSGADLDESRRGRLAGCLWKQRVFEASGYNELNERPAGKLDAEAVSDGELGTT